MLAAAGVVGESTGRGANGMSDDYKATLAKSRERYERDTAQHALP